jgi:hypothetical protein
MTITTLKIRTNKHTTNVVARAIDAEGWSTDATLELAIYGALAHLIECLECSRETATGIMAAEYDRAIRTAREDLAQIQLAA